jgi:hypothetical protein
LVFSTDQVQNQAVSILRYFDKFHPLPKAAQEPEIAHIVNKEFKPDPARWGKGVGFGNVAMVTQTQQIQKQRVAQQDENAKLLLTLLTNIIVESTISR